MRHSRLGALILVLGAALAPAPAPAAGAVLEDMGTFVWRDADPDFGGFSGIEITEDGTRFHALTDRAHLFWGRVDRDAQGAVRDMVIEGRANLRDRSGNPLPAGYRGDSEGIAIGADGRIWVSFEGLHRVVAYDHPEAAADPLPFPPKLPGMRPNAGLESLAIRDDGTILAVPEQSSGPATPFTVLAFDGEWREHALIRRDPRWLPVGADIGPDGMFYLLERDFRGPLGFASRLRRMDLVEGEVARDEVLMESRSMQYDNLEGISVWDDGEGPRITLISDDNFLFLQRTELVEFRLHEGTDRRAAN
ncbi:esterase-like activity of phytase family protein [Paracoccus aestuarii]|nr:esterase-like activity of phytase family protein [Paracoccus aestuarii]